jgi:hypothetical protein
MSPPPKDKIVAAMAALRGDAKVWHDNSAELGTAAQLAVSLSLDPSAFSSLGEQVGLPGVYQGLYEKVGLLLQEGTGNFDGVAGALTKAADGYERDEQYAVHEMLDKW